MKAVVLYESVYGNTHQVADAVAEGLRGAGAEVATRTVAELAPGEAVGVDLVVVGGPTHAHGMSRPSTRKGAVDTAAKEHDPPAIDPSALGPGLREWFDTLPGAVTTAAAAFDTRIDKPPVLVGSAARGIAKRLRRHGFRLAAEPESFFVDGSEGPLHEGEQDRARDWGESLVRALAAREA